MAKARAIVKRRRSIQNIRKITRTMELIATARYKKAFDRAVQAEAFTTKIAELVAELGRADTGGEKHPLLQEHKAQRNTLLLVLTSNRGLAGGYNANVIRQGYRDYQELTGAGQNVQLEVVGKRGINFLRFRGIRPHATYTSFEDRVQYEELEAISNKYINLYVSGAIDRLDVAYTRFVSMARQEPTVVTLLPLTQSENPTAAPSAKAGVAQGSAPPRFRPVPYEFLPDAQSILDDLVPVSFKVRLFKCFLDAAVSEQIARMVAMRGATESADDMIKVLTRLYNRARQSQITRELAEIVGGAAALD